MDVKAMRKLLADVYGISSDAQLEQALKDIGGVPIALFVDRKGENENGSISCCDHSNRC